jgi:glutaredoxin
MSSARTAARAVFLAGAVLCAGLASAQVYRIVGPDGKVTFSDRPPVDAKATPARTVPLAGGNGTPVASLPLEVRQAAGRYPVTLYTSANCGPCDSARSYLRQRGVPYTEYTVSTRDDLEALQRLSGSGTVPFMTLGAQHVPGFSQAEWSQYFDAAGYPKSSQLPPSYRQAAAQPLVAVQRAEPAPRAAAPAQEQQPQSADAAPPAPGPSADNPAGIRF